MSNSLVHREFSTTRISRIIIEKDRIYADNRNRSTQFGKLNPSTFTPEPKNPLLAHFFENIGYADQLGSGVRNLYRYTSIYTDGGEPELIEGDTFKTIIPLPSTVTPEVTEKVTERVTEGVTEKVTEKERAALIYIEQNPAITATELAERLSVSRKTASARIKELKDKGLIERIGSDKKGYWKIIKKERKVTEKVTEGVTEEVTEKERAALIYIEQNPAITATELAERLSVSRKTASARIKELKDKRFIERIGSDKKGYWKIIKKKED